MRRTGNKNDLMELFDFAIAQEKKFVAVKVKIAGQDAPEVILNSNSSFKKKKEYYDKAYNKDLTLKATSDIKITEFVAFDMPATLLNFIGLEI
jgi:hypothetical protein